jgi:hypothetical protein
MVDGTSRSVGTTGSLRNRLYGPCGTFPESHERIVVDVGALVRRLLLFNTYVLDSYRLLEVPRLVATFGSSGLVALLRAGVLKISCEAISFANVGHTLLNEKRRLRGPLPLGSFSYSVVKSAEPEKYISDCLKNAVRVQGLDLKRAIKLKREIVDALANSPETSGYETLAATLSDIKNDRLLASAISRAIESTGNGQIAVDSVAARVTMIDEVDFKVESNLERLGVGDSGAVHKVIERALGGIVNANRVLEVMKERNSLTGVADDSEAFLGEKLGIMVPELWRDDREQQFDRVVELAGFPDVSADADDHLVDAEQLLKIRESSECSEFRQWLQTLGGGVTDAEIRERVRAWNSVVGAFLKSGTGRALRFLATSAIGMVPEHGPVAGAVAGALDTFVLDKVFSGSGPAAFINNQYRSLFRADL